MADINTSSLGGISKGDTASRPETTTNGSLYYNTETSVLEVYDAGWWLPNTTPEVPTSPVATNSGSGRAFNNGRASVAFTPATSGGKATSFTVTSTPGSYTNTGSSSPIVVTGLQSSTQYTYAVTATGPLGTSAASSASSGVTATTVPQAPTIGSVTGGNAFATVAYTAGATGGSTITTFTATSSPGGLTGTGESPITVSGLNNGTAYTFTVTATNVNGTSAASSASSSVTPSAFLTFETLMVAGGGGGGAGGGGGGGAGGLLYTSPVLLAPGTAYTITVGGGGALNTVEGTLGNKGSNSVISGSGFTTLTAEGGGGGGASTSPEYSNATNTQINGGSGGGSRRDANNVSTLRGLANGSQGNNGGLSTASYYVSASGGGGAGAVGGSSGGPGGSPDSTLGSRAGGVGLNTYSTWASATSSGDSGYYAGGGGGSAYGPGGVGGTGGGGTGSNYYTPTNGTNGTANTGGGGGGGSGGSPYYYGRAGGSGINILRYYGSITASNTTGSPTRYETGGYTYYKFNSTGSITF